MRTRIGVEKAILNDLSIFVQFQDSRIWGQERSTAASISNVDIHQAYAYIKNIFNAPVYAQAGRIEVSYATQRFIGASGWSYISRAFDGLRIGYKSEPFWIDVFGFDISSSQGFLNSYENNTHPYPLFADSSFCFTGFWSNLKFAEGNALDLFTYYEADLRKGEFDRGAKDTTFSGKRNIELNRITSGLNYNLKFGDFSLLLEAAYQFGNYTKASKLNKKDTVVSYSKVDLSAYTAAVRLQFDFDPCSVSLNTEVMSGTKNADTLKTNNNTYDNSYATKHSLFGYMDYFSNMEKSTLNLGLYDFYLRYLYQQKESPFNAEFAAHYFMVANPAWCKIEQKEVSDLGPEFDLVLRYIMAKNATLEWGCSAFLPGKAMKIIYDTYTGDTIFTREDLSFWSYLMLRVSI
jgi:hypothetical protein